MKSKALLGIGRSAGYAAAFVLVLVLTFWIFRMPIWSSLDLMVTGAFGDKYALGRTAANFTPLLLTGLGVVIAWRAGMFNIGGEGQYVVGGLTGAWIARILMDRHASPTLVLFAVLIGSVVGGGIWGGIAGLLKVKRSVDVVISTILLNFIGIQIEKWAVSGPLMEHVGGTPVTDQLPSAAMLWHPDPQTDLHVGLLIAIGAAVLVWFLMYRTNFGFMLRFAGSNPGPARANRLPVTTVQVGAMVISGALCGLAGGVQYLGINGQIGMDFSQNWGFLAIPAALVGWLDPLWLMASSLVFGGLFAGSVNLSRFTTSGDTLIYFVQAVAVFVLVGMQSYQAMRKPKGGED